MPPTRPPADPRLQAFREEVRAILALSGGINAVSMGKIRHRGQAAGLEPEEVEVLVANLRTGEQVESRNLVAYRKTIRAILKKARLQPGDLLTPRLAGKLEETGVSRYKLTRSDAAQEVRDQARELGLKRLSPEVAVETFRQQVRAARDAGPLTPARMKVLKKFAATLGVDDDRFDSLVREEVRTALAHPVEIRRANGRFLASVISAAVIAVLGFFLIMSFYRPRIVPPANTSSVSKPRRTSAPVPAVASPPAPNPAEPEAPREPVLTLARRVFVTPADQAILDGLASTSEAERIGAMRSLLLRLDLHRETPEQSQTLARLVSFLLGTDPSSSLVTMTLESLHDRLDLLDASRSLTARSIDSGLWALDTLLEALVEPNLDPQRAETLAGEIDSVLGAGATQSLLASSAKQATVEVHHVRSKFVRSLYEKLTKETVRDASQASVPEAEAALFTRAAGVLPDGERTGLRADLLATALDASGGAWDRYLDAVRQVLDQGTAKDVENILNVYLNTQNTVLQQALELELRNRLDDSSALVSPSEVAEAFRLKGRSGGSRRAVFEERATASLARAKASKGPTETMRQVVDLTLTSTLACALEQGEAGYPEFDSLLKGPPKVDAPANVALPAAPAPPPVATFFRGPGQRPAGSLDQAIAGLGSRNAWERVSACEALARQFLPDNLPDHQAFAIARYVLWGGKSRQEDATASTCLVPLTKPTSVRMAMADIIGDIRPLSRKFRMVDASAAERMLISITGQPVNLNASDWKDQARRILLFLVLTDLDPGLDTAAEQYRLLYQTQGRLLGMPDSDSLLTSRPSQMVEVVANHLVSRLSKSRETLSQPDRERLDQVSRDLSTADYLAPDEPQRLVLAQRAWLRALSVLVASNRPESASDARALADDLTPEEVHEDDVLEQLRAGEVRAVRLWKLLIQAKK